MSIRIREERCVGCGKCQEVCPGTLIQIIDRKAVMKYPKNCWGCVSCVKECKAGAIEFYLGADIGGMGGTMNVTQKGDLLNWNITRSDGSELVISVDRRNSNIYYPGSGSRMRKTCYALFHWKRQLSDASSRTESLLSGKTTFPVFTCKYNLEIQGNDRVS